jgi:hypothetical protein
METIRKPLEELGPPAMSINEFCWHQGISAATYYKLRKLGRGPAEMRLAGNIVRITPEAEKAWREARANPSSDEAADVATCETATRARALHASKSAVASPRHIAARRRAASAA